MTLLPGRDARQVVTLLLVTFLGLAPAAGARQAKPAEARAPAEKAGAQAVSPEQLQAAINKLGAFEYADRAKASRTVRRAPAGQAIPALIQAVTEHTDGYVRFRALVLLTGFPDPRLRDLMLQFLSDPNDRLRQVAYRYFESNPDPAMAPRLLAALETEHAEFVRPALVRALAALGSDPKVQAALVRDIGRGENVFRSAVIEALGDYHAAYAVPALIGVTGLEGTLREDAALALGKIGNKQALPTLSGLQRTAPRESQPEIAAAICLLGVNCTAHIGFLDRTLRFAEKNPGYQELLRGAATGLAAIAVGGNEEVVDLLFDIGLPSQDPVRAPVTLALGTVALRNTPLILKVLEKRADRPAAVRLLAEAFDMLEEDYDKERFFVAVRHAYWQAPEGSPARETGQLLIQKLDF